MAKTLQASGQYKVKDTSEIVSYEFDYTVIDSVADAVAELGEDKVKSLIQRQIKVDANNVTREKVKASNGHSDRQPMTEEQKAEAKAKRAEDKAILNALKEKGLTMADIANL